MNGIILFILISMLPASIDASCKIALIFGSTGQDGIYLTNFLLEKGYVVHGTLHNSATRSIDNKYHNNFFTHLCDLSNIEDIIDLLELVRPDEVYNLAAQSSVRLSFDQPLYTASINALNTLKILEAIRKVDCAHMIRFYQASSSEMFGNTNICPQNELTAFRPRSPYAIAKLHAYWATVHYRECYGMFACNGILFNHESPLRGEEFVTRKITKAVARIYKGEDEVLYLGNLDVRRDWGYAKDYVEAMWLMLQQDQPDDYVIATGKTHTIRQFVELAFQEIGIVINWRGSGSDEVGFNPTTGKVLIRINPEYFRPLEIDVTVGDPSKAKNKLAWTPSTPLPELVKIMVHEDIRKLS